MAVTDQQIFDFFLGKPTDEQTFAAMKTFGISPQRIAAATGAQLKDVISRLAPFLPRDQAVLLGDTWVQGNYAYGGSGEDQQLGPLETINVYKTSGGVNDKLPVGTDVQVYNPSGEFVNTYKTKADQSFVGGLFDALKDPVVLAALGGAAASGLLGGTAAGTAAGTAGTTAGTVAGTTAGTASGLGAGSSLGTGLTAGAGGLGLSTTGAGLGALGTGAGITAGTGLTGTGILTGSALGTGLLGTTAGALTGTGILSGSNLGTQLLGTGAGTGVTGALSTGVGAGTLGTGALTTGLEGLGSGLSSLGTNIGTGIGTGLTNAALANLISTGLTTGAGLLQQQTSKEAAIAAQQRIDAETAAAKQAAQFRPVGMTTRFGTSEFKVDPVTGQITSAGYTLSPEAKAAQDRLVNLAGAGLTQAEAAQEQFKPLQTGAENLFTLGNEYIAQSPQEVAQNYLNQQMALLQPGRELELANLQNKLFQQGRSGVAVAQGGTYGATTPELQALYNARAMQEAQLAAQAQQAGQQQVAFGAGLLGTGAQTMGQYYAGQQAAYAPYTTALGQVQGLEQLGQQPFTMGTQLGQTAAQAGANVGQLGLRGAEQSVALATGQAATNNPYASLLGGLGASPAFGTAAGSALTSLFG